MTKPLPTNWIDLLNQERKALKFAELPANIKAIFTKRINSVRGDHE